VPFTDEGSQEIFIDYDQSVDASTVSRRLDQHLPPGIYSGGNVSIVSASEAEISPATMEVRDDNEEQVKVETRDTVTLSPSSSEPYLVFTWTRKEAEGWYGNFQVSSAIPPHAIVFGEAKFDGNGDLDNIDFSKRSIPNYKEAHFSDGVDLEGYFKFHRIEVSTDHTVSEGEQLIGVNHSSPTTITLPDISTGYEVIVKDEAGNAGSESIVVSGSGSIQIDGQSSVQISQSYGSKEFYFDGTSWREI
jgi:hypothetical protein